MPICHARDSRRLPRGNLRRKDTAFWPAGPFICYFSPNGHAGGRIIVSAAATDLAVLPGHGLWSTLPLRGLLCWIEPARFLFCFAARIASIMVQAVLSPIADLERLLAGAQLPALPQSAIRLLELARDAENGPVEFAGPIEADPGLTSQVLRFVNSSYFGFSREISSVKLAITLVGIRTIKNFALWSAVFSIMPNPKCGPFDLKHLWQDSLRRGLFAREFAKLLGMKDGEAPFAAALLQDLAVPLLAKEMAGKYEQVLIQRKDGERLSELERAAFGWTHAQAGAVIARKWNLPEEFARLIENHTELDAMLSRGSGEVGQLAVALSALLPATSDENWDDCQAFETAYEKIRGSQAPIIADVLAQVDEQFTEFAPLLHIASPSKTLAEAYREATFVTP